MVVVLHNVWVLLVLVCVVACVVLFLGLCVSSWACVFVVVGGLLLGGVDNTLRTLTQGQFLLMNGCFRLICELMVVVLYNAGVMGSCVRLLVWFFSWFVCFFLGHGFC